MKKFLLSTVMATVIMGGALAALAEDPAAKPEDTKGPGQRHHWGERFFQEMDTNGDGAISQEEHEAFNKKRFTEIDADSDGKLTKEEMQAHRAAKHEKYKQMREQQKEGAPKDEAPKAGGE